MNNREAVNWLVNILADIGKAEHSDLWGYKQALTEIKDMLESVQRKPGHFIGTEFDGYADGNPVYQEWKCSECGCVFEDDEPTYNYCPNCGAKMENNNDG